MLIKKSIVLLLLLSTSLLSQQIGIWKNYTNMDDVMSISSTNSDFWIATSGGAGYFSNSSSMFEFFLTSSEGLSSQNITALEEDSKGNIWFGMQNGMIDIYSPTDKSTRPIKEIFERPNTSKTINEILIVDSVAYVATEFCLSLINTNNIGFISSTLKFGSFSSSIVVNNVTVDDKIYVSTASGIAIQKDGAINLVAPESWESYHLGIDISAKKTNAVLKYNNNLIVATDRGLFKFNGATWDHYAYSEEVLDIKIDGNNLMVLFNNSLHSYDGVTDKEIYSSSDKLFRKIEVSDKGVYLIASNTGTIRVQENNNEVLLPNGPINNSFESLAVDKDGALWVGTGKDPFGSGFMKLENELWSSFNTSSMPELPNNNYHNVSADDYQVYLSNWGSGLTIEEDGVFSYFNASNSELEGIPGSQSYVVIMNAQRDSKGDLWFFNFASSDGKPLIQLTTDSTWYHYKLPTRFPALSEDYHMVDGLIDEYNTKWFNVLERGLYYLNENNSPADESDDIWGQLTASSGLNSNTVNAIALDKRGELWIGTTSGMNILANTSSPSSLITSVFSLRQQSISAIAVDPLNNKWVGTYEGLFVMSPDGSQQIAHYDSKNSPLPTDNINSLAIDKKSGLVYIGTSFGLSTLTTASVEPKQEFDQIKIYPSPFKIGIHEQVSFDGLVKNSTIKIISISGKLIKTLETPGGRIAFWDGKDESGKFVASGIYLLVAFDEEADKIITSKFAIIR